MTEYREITEPVVPKYVADWYEENKYSFENKLAYLITDYIEGHIEDDNLYEWLGGLGAQNMPQNKPITTLVKMKLFDYEVQKEKLYTVEIPSDDSQWHFILCKNTSGKVVGDATKSERWKERDNVKLTESEIKKKYEKYWKYAEEVKDNND